MRLRQYLPLSGFPALLLVLWSCGTDASGPDLSAVDEVEVSPPFTSVKVGENVQLTVEVLNVEGTPLDRPVTWTSSPPGIVTVTSSGLVQGLVEGLSTVTASVDGESGSATVTVLDADPPAPPSNVTAVPFSDTQINVSWTDNADNENSFRVEREQIGGTASQSAAFTIVGTVSSNVTSFRDSGLMPLTSYRYRVIAVNDNGEASSGASGAATTLEQILITEDVPDGTAGVNYTGSLSATGGAPPYTWSLVNGTLPPGVALSPAGNLSGAPGLAGSFTSTVRATGTNGQSKTHQIQIDVAPGADVSDGYDILLYFQSAIAPEHQAAFETARARWESIIAGDVPDVGPLDDCLPAHPATPHPTDDLVLYITVEEIDGELGTLGEAGFCWIRTASILPITGAMRLDAADLDLLHDLGLMVSTVQHEMGHVLGVGTVWEALDLIDPELCLQDVVFTGANAIAAFDAAGGASYLGPKVPVENGGSLNDGSNCSHWRETVLRTELMTPQLNGSQFNPLSEITIQSLTDIGYTVNPNQGDAYVVPAPPPAAARLGSELLFSLENDIMRITPRAAGPDGRPALLHTRKTPR